MMTWLNSRPISTKNLQAIGKTTSIAEPAAADEEERREDDEREPRSGARFG